ncbi:hypothetical protein KJY73_07080 [Bowmanella sp. Y26]|uniref:hypothetical protein n=1 Tax=Bowmanella yangjiangensis TaxID=2811230 RepID=UPI001BDCF698|nr:hypothetical protein [Bowmanella yangjiangensis]MBT1063331.1 hypothetical protein [Bowmanella yangjiangensis]
MKIRDLISASLLLTLCACSNKGLYDNLRLQQRHECMKQPPTTNDKCLEDANKSYEEYQREREEALKTPQEKSKPD